jgi:hypothetical protein
MSKRKSLCTKLKPPGVFHRTLAAVDRDGCLRVRAATARLCKL